ncbi:MAG: 23S rRNA (adenine(2503)-C(2))-methyltransferase RlmN [Planctomycetes bacterium]|nr:23S rRNA (adenine(2503)-C(2))-methyltransferase RlmN [Planctomycetota bacterium]
MSTSPPPSTDPAAAELVGSGLSGLGRVLSREKTLLARRLVAAGRTVTPHEFDRRGFRLSEREWGLVQQWLARGLVTSVVERTEARDGTVKMLVALRDGKKVESVAMPTGACCVSTQVGCAVGCRFCASGMFGVRRNLSAGEIAEQVLVARARLPEGRKLTNLVVMGMGEPMLNLDGLLPALQRIHDPDGIGLGARRITVSTSGYPRQMQRFAEADPSYNLAVSLHAADDQLRRELVPTATHTVAEIVAAAHAYCGQKGREVTYEVVLLEGKNDRRIDANAMVDALRGMPCTVNLIPWNPVDEIVARHGLQRPQSQRVDAFAETLRQGGLNVTVRRQRGADRSAACGQLRLREATA